MREIPGFVVYGPPRTKKTGQRIIHIPRKGAKRCHCGHLPGFPKVLPSEAHDEWLGAALKQMLTVRGKLAAAGITLPIAGPVSIDAQIYVKVSGHDRMGDACGYYQAIGDMLQEAGIIVNDKQIEDWDGSRRLIDSAHPRIEIFVTALEPAQASLL